MWSGPTIRFYCKLSHNNFKSFDQGFLYKITLYQTLNSGDQIWQHPIAYGGCEVTVQLNNAVCAVLLDPLSLDWEMRHPFVHHIKPKQAFSPSCLWSLCVWHKIRSSRFQKPLPLSSYRQPKVQILLEDYVTIVCP